MARRRFTEEEINEIANKEWKQTPIFTSDEKVAYKARNLTGPKTPEGKAKSLANLRVGKNKGEVTHMSHGGYVKRLLDEDEQQIYAERKEVWLKDFTDFNESADGLLLHLVLMDEVILYRLMRRQFENPSLDIERPYNECSARIAKNTDALGTQRKQRMKQDERLTSISIATIAQQFNKELMGGSIHSILDEQREEEEQFLLNKQKREREAQTVDADYEVVREEVDIDEEPE